MCDDCDLSVPICGSRRRFLRNLAVVLASPGLLGPVRAAARIDLPAAAKAGWSRIIIPNELSSPWEAQDSALAEFIKRETSLTFDTRFYRVDPGDIDALCRYPFMFAHSLIDIHDRRLWRNIGDYLIRGGFIYNSNCHSSGWARTTALTGTLNQLRGVIPGSEIIRLRSSHAIFQSPFPIADNPSLRDSLEPEGPSPIFGLFDADRMVALVSAAQLYCNRTTDNVACLLRLLTNIYVYALSH